MGGVFNCVNLHVYHYAGNNPVKYVDPDGRDIDFLWVAAREGGQRLTGFVPQKPPDSGNIIANSGVTIATGFDLGAQNIFDLNRIFGRGNENQDLKDIYAPYLLLKKQDALNFLNTPGNELTITQEQANRTDILVRAAYVNTVKRQYSTATGGNFDILPDQAQTVLFSLIYHLGSISADIMNEIKRGNFLGAADMIQALGEGNDFADRRRLEANLLRQVPNVINNTPGEREQ
jgi:GH24 family phage-related lysozyme (muramidase)